MSPELTKSSVVPALIEAAPELQTVLGEHLEDMGGEVLPHLLFGDLTRFVAEAHGQGSDEVVHRILDFLETAIQHGDGYVRNLVAVSFIENIGVWESEMASLVAALPPALRAGAGAGGPLAAARQPSCQWPCQ